MPSPRLDHIPGYVVRPMIRPELDFALELAAAEGWNPGLNDAEPFWAADPGGFLVGELDGRLVGCISAVRYGQGFGFIGLYIVVPELRGRGLGIRLWNAAMDQLEGRGGGRGGGRNIGLDGVVAQQDNYRKSGFQWAFRSIRFQGRGCAPGMEETPGVITSPLTSADLDEVLAYDRLCFPEVRENFLRAWLFAPGTRAFTARDKADRLAGYGSLRPCLSGFKIGPLFADDQQAAQALLTALITTVHGQAGPDADIYWDVAEVHAPAVALAQSLGMVRVFETARMYTKGAPPLDQDRVWGVTTFELG